MHYLIVVGSGGSSHFGPLLEHLVGCFVDRERRRYGDMGETPEVGSVGEAIDGGETACERCFRAGQP